MSIKWIRFTSVKEVSNIRNTNLLYFSFFKCLHVEKKDHCGGLIWCSHNKTIFISSTHSLLTSPRPYVSSRFLDTSKQAIGMLFIHFANVYLSDLTEEDPCSLWVCVSAAVTVVPAVDTPFSLSALLCVWSCVCVPPSSLPPDTSLTFYWTPHWACWWFTVAWKQSAPLLNGGSGIRCASENTVKILHLQIFFISLIKRHVFLSTVDCLTVQFVLWRTLCLGLFQSCHFTPLNGFHLFITYRFWINSII